MCLGDAYWRGVCRYQQSASDGDAAAAVVAFCQAVLSTRTGRAAYQVLMTHIASEPTSPWRDVPMNLLEGESDTFHELVQQVVWTLPTDEAKRRRRVAANRADERGRPDLWHALARLSPFS
jgi:hypothetical protein